MDSNPEFEENSGTARFVGEHGNCEPIATNNFQTMKLGASNKLAPNDRTEIPHSELVKMLYFLEGELQARDVVIAALRNERVKQYISQLRTKRVQTNDPYAAIFRDKITLAGNLVSLDGSMQAAQAEMEVRQIIEQQMEQQYQMVSKQRATHVKMVSILTESLENNQRMLQELEETKRKHEHDTAQGDDITYGLELERTKLRQELEDERVQVKKLEKDIKKLQETLDFERNRQKQIVLLLIAERKKILVKYIEEGKRSEDLAQILAEEKQRSDTIAEGLEEESKKSLRMEEELEKQAAAFENERKTLKANLAKEENRVKELEQELALMRSANEIIKNELSMNANNIIPNVAVLAKSRPFNDETCATPAINIAKIVQPTATVSSVPVSGPQTGIARSLAPGQNIRSTGVIAPLLPNVAQPVEPSSSITLQAVQQAPPSIGVAAAQPSPAKMQPTATIQRAPGGKFAALAAASSHSMDQPHSGPIAVPPVTVPSVSAVGTRPPIPPNKPIVPPKREPSLSRLGSISGSVNPVAPTTATSAAASTSVSTNSLNSK